MALNIRALRNLVEELEAEEEAERSNKHGANYGSAGSFNNYGGGNQNYTGAKINSGENSGNRNNRYTYDNHGGNATNNSGGTFSGNGNGSSIGGNFDASTRTYY